MKHSASHPGCIEIPIQTVVGNQCSAQNDRLAVEEPLEIRLGFGAHAQRSHKSISVTMRTPGDDPDLAAGFLFTEAIIESAAQIESIHACGDPAKKLKAQNVVRVELHPDVTVDLTRLERHFYTTSSCGVCGKTSIEALQLGACAPLPSNGPVVESALIHGLPEKLRKAQAIFDQTGGLHAAALFDFSGELVALREDVGRHNAVDKLIGSQLCAGKTPLHARLMLLSGRASFELVQKALRAGIPLVAAVGAPSSLAVELAAQFKMTLLGFVRGERFNVYCGAERLRR